MVTTSAPAPLDDSGNANPDFDFRYDPTLPGYIYNLSLKGISTGSYNLNFMVSGDPVLSFCGVPGEVSRAERTTDNTWGELGASTVAFRFLALVMDASICGVV